MSAEHDQVLILDFGSQFTQLIARRIREERVYCEIHPPTRSLEWIREWESDGRHPVAADPRRSTTRACPPSTAALLHVGHPAPGYLLRHAAHRPPGGRDGASTGSGSTVGRSSTSELGEGLFAGFDAGRDDHRLVLARRPRGRASLRGTRASRRPRTLPVAAFRGPWTARSTASSSTPRWPTRPGATRSSRTSSSRCAGCRPTGRRARSSRTRSSASASRWATRTVICGLSGGVDSSVAAVLVHRAIGDRLTCIFVDHGLLRKHEREQVERMFRSHYDMKLVVEDASELFLAGPRRRHRPGGEAEGHREHVHRGLRGPRHARGHRAPTFLVQGTLYPDVIESVSAGGPR